MTSKEAVKICETDLACGGFTFYGSNENPEEKRYIYFVHYIHVNRFGIETEDSMWTTYRYINLGNGILKH